MANDLYGVLGVSSSATQPEIKKAYRQIARKFHPDKNPGDENAANIFALAVEAYRILGDVEQRIQYDRYGRTSANSVPSGGGGAQSKPTPENPSDVFREIFGTSPRGRKTSKSRSDVRPRAGPSKSRSQARSASSSRKFSDRKKSAYSGQKKSRRRAIERGDDLRYTLELRLEELAFGCDKSITVPRKDRCGPCAGTGAQSGTSPVICHDCDGAGKQIDDSGFFSTSTPCGTCEGTGKLVATSCLVCEGSGLVTAHVSIEVSVPEGIEEGTRLRIKGEGEIGRGGGSRGDLYVVVQMKAHPFFKRENNDVVVEVPIRFDQAAMGATIEVPTLEGRIRMRIPPGSQSGREFRLKAKGFRNSSGRGRGDQRIRVIVEIPIYLTEEQSQLLRRYANLETQHNENSLVRDYLQMLDDYF